MRRIWMVVVALAWVVLATDARADTVYLTNGQSIWGRDAYEEGDFVVIVRPGGDLRVPKSQVSRIERTHSTLPPFYTSPPETAPAGEPGTRAIGPAGAPGTPGTPGAPAQAGVPAPPGPPGGSWPLLHRLEERRPSFRRHLHPRHLAGRVLRGDLPYAGGVRYRVIKALVIPQAAKPTTGCRKTCSP